MLVLLVTLRQVKIEAGRVRDAVRIIINEAVGPGSRGFRVYEEK